MSQKAWINGAEYRFLERVPSLEGKKSYVICEDADGKYFVCPEDLWLAHVPRSVQAAPVTTHSSVQEKIECFLAVFQGRGAVCAAILQRKNREERLHARVQKRVGAGVV